MKVIEITMEKTIRATCQFGIPDSVYDEIKRTERIPDNLFSRMEKALVQVAEGKLDGDIYYDYTVECDDETLIDWEE